MLNTVPTQIRIAARAVIKRHPNAFNCQVFRKVVDRSDETLVGGMPTMGGMAVLDSEDEENYSWNFVGNGFAVRADQFQTALYTQLGDANIGAEDEYRFLITPEDEPDQANHFDIKKHDILSLMLGNVRLNYEIVNQETTVDIPPYVSRYVCNRRDLVVLEN